MRGDDAFFNLTVVEIQVAPKGSVPGVVRRLGGERDVYVAGEFLRRARPEA